MPGSYGKPPSVTDLLTGILTAGAISSLTGQQRKPGQQAAQPVNPAGSVADAGALSVASVMDAGVVGTMESMRQEISGELQARFGTVGVKLGDFDLPVIGDVRNWWVRHKTAEIYYPRRFTRAAQDSRLVRSIYPGVPLDMTKGALKLKIRAPDIAAIAEDLDGWVEKNVAKAVEVAQIIRQTKLVETISMLAGPEGALATMVRASIRNRSLPASVAMYVHTAMMPHKYPAIRDAARFFGDKQSTGFVAKEMANVLAKQKGVVANRLLQQLGTKVSKDVAAQISDIRDRIYREINNAIVKGEIRVNSFEELQQIISQKAQDVVDSVFVDKLARAMQEQGVDITPDEVKRFIQSDPRFQSNLRQIAELDLLAKIPVTVAGNVMDDRSVVELRRNAEARKAELTLEAASGALERSPDYNDKNRAERIKRERDRIKQAADEFTLHPFDRGVFTLAHGYTLYLAAKQFKAENAQALQDPVEWFKTLLIGGGNFYRLAGVGIDIDTIDLGDMFTHFIQAHPDQEMEGFGRISNGRLEFDGGMGAGGAAVPAMPRFLARRVPAARWAYIAGALHPVEMARRLFFGELHYQLFYIGSGFADPDVLAYMDQLMQNGRSLLHLSEAELRQLQLLLESKYGQRLGRLMFKQFNFAVKLAQNPIYKRWMKFGRLLGQGAKWITSPQTAAFELYLNRIVKPAIKEIAARYNPMLSAIKTKLLKGVVKLAGKAGIKLTVKGAAAALSMGASLLYEAVNLLTFGLLDKVVFKTLYYSFLFIIFATILVITVIFSVFSGIGGGLTSMVAVPPKNKSLQLVTVGEAIEPPGAFGIVSVGTACWRQKRLPNGADVGQADTPLEDAICPFNGGYYITQCALDGDTSNYHQSSGAVDFVPAGSVNATLVSPVDGIVTFCNTTENCGCRVAGNGGGAIMIYSGGYYYFFLHVYANPDLCERAAAGEIVYVKKGDTIAVGLYERADACTTGPHVHFEIISENNQHPYGGETCRFLVEKCGSPSSTTCPATCK